MLSEAMLVKVLYIVSGAIFILSGVMYYDRPDSAPAVNISIGIFFICFGIAQS
jgi:hypothetical protein